MIGTSTPPLNYDFPKQMMVMMLDAIDKGTKRAYEMLWSAGKQIFIIDWLPISLFLVFLLGIAFLNYKLTGRWGMLGSVLYHYFFGAIVLVLVLIFGPDIFASVWIDLILFIVYLICFKLVGMIFVHKRTNVNSKMI